MVSLTGNVSNTTGRGTVKINLVKARSSEILTQLLQTSTITVPSVKGKVEQAQSHYVISMPVPIKATMLASLSCS